MTSSVLPDTTPDRHPVALFDDFVLGPQHHASAPPETRGTPRDRVKLMVSSGGETPVHTRFDDLSRHLDAGDLLVVNNSATRPAAIDASLHDGRSVVIHLSSRLPADLWLVEPRQRIENGSTVPLHLDPRPTSVTLIDGSRLDLLRLSPGSQRLWVTASDVSADLDAVMDEHGRAIRYPYVESDWPMSYYQTVFSEIPGSAEMPSAARPFSSEVVTSLVRRGVGIVTLTLHTGVSSLEGHEAPYPEQFDVPEATAAAINSARSRGRRIIAVGTTVVRALETAADETGLIHPASGWTDVVVTPESGIRSVDGLLTGWHEPLASHLAMLEAIAGRPGLIAAYRSALSNGYLWHEFGDSHLILPGGGSS
jgi:S-adenosylmethionine:tRNA ribosyltransferase-isomerase